MIFFDILKLALRNLREAKLRVTLTTIGVVVGVTVIVTMVSFGLGLQRNAVQRFKDLDLFNEITVTGQDVSELVAQVFNRGAQNGGEDRRAVAVALAAVETRPPRETTASGTSAEACARRCGGRGDRAHSGRRSG